MSMRERRSQHEARTVLEDLPVDAITYVGSSPQEFRDAPASSSRRVGETLPPRNNHYAADTPSDFLSHNESIIDPWDKRAHQPGSTNGYSQALKHRNHRRGKGGAIPGGIYSDEVHKVSKQDRYKSVEQQGPRPQVHVLTAPHHLEHAKADTPADFYSGAHSVGPKFKNRDPRKLRERYSDVEVWKLDSERRQRSKQEQAKAYTTQLEELAHKRKEEQKQKKAEREQIMAYNPWGKTAKRVETKPRPPDWEDESQFKGNQMQEHTALVTWNLVEGGIVEDDIPTDPYKKDAKMTEAALKREFTVGPNAGDVMSRWFGHDDRRNRGERMGFGRHRAERIWQGAGEGNVESDSFVNQFSQLGSGESSSNGAQYRRHAVVTNDRHHEDFVGDDTYIDAIGLGKSVIKARGRGSYTTQERRFAESQPELPGSLGQQPPSKTGVMRHHWNEFDPGARPQPAQQWN